MSDNIFTDKKVDLYHEEAALTDFLAFKKVIESRRSIRRFKDKQIPDEVVRECLRLALLAPTSSNLQSWEFYWVRSEDKRKALAEACFSQPAATTAPVLIVAVARTNTWKRNSKLLIEQLKVQGARPSMIAYYQKLVPFAYGLMGPFGIFSPLKWLLISAMGLFRPVPRDPMSPSGLRAWAHKTTSLACENLMLAFRAAGYDTCPMEGFDECRAKKIIGLGHGAHITMIISAGLRDQGGVYGKQSRLPQELFLFEV